MAIRDGRKPLERGTTGKPALPARSMATSRHLTIPATVAAASAAAVAPMMMLRWSPVHGAVLVLAATLAAEYASHRPLTTSARAMAGMFGWPIVLSGLVTALPGTADLWPSVAAGAAGAALGALIVAVATGIGSERGARSDFAEAREGTFPSVVGRAHSDREERGNGR